MHSLKKIHAWAQMKIPLLMGIINMLNTMDFYISSAGIKIVMVFLIYW